MANALLRTRLRTIGRRLLIVGATAGMLWGLTGGIVVLIVAAWLDLIWELTSPLRVTAWIAAGTGGLSVLAGLAASTALAARAARVARRLDQVGRTGGTILTGLELDAPGAGVQNSATLEITAGLAEIAVARAADVARDVPAVEAAPVGPVGRSLGSLAAVVALIGLAALLLPRLVWTQGSRLLYPYADIPPYSRTMFEVEPGDVEVLYGSMQDIRAAIVGEPVDEVELVLESGGRQETLPMFPEPDGRWRAVLSKVTEPARYFVRSYQSRSKRYAIGVITVPQIRSVHFTVSPPRYTRQAPYRGPLPKDGIAGLPGTRVQVTVESNRPLARGTIKIAGADQPISLPLKPQNKGSSEVAGEFRIAGDGKFELSVVDTAGQPSLDPFCGTITLLTDQRPLIRLTQPRSRSLATPTSTIPVAVAAEDDYGLSRLQLYRSLNDSRALPMEIALAAPPPQRSYETVPLPLSAYGLQPGDMIKLFGRVEDSDPAGAKGSESPVVTLQIISQEDFERLVRIRQGLEVLLSKYREARRRMESVAGEMEGLRKNLEEAAPGSPVADGARRELARLMKRMREEAEAIRKSAEHELPYDIDKNLSSRLAERAADLEEMARQLEALEKQLSPLEDESDLKSEQLARQLARLLNKLQADRQKFDHEAMEPMEHLGAVMPLVACSSEFVMLVLAQMDLAERMASLKGPDGDDDPAQKARMRELQEEQEQLRGQLDRLMENILDHAEQLPDDEQLDTLRETAMKLVRDVEASGAREAMQEAESALAEFSGTRGHEKAQEAADILAKLLKRCDGMGGEGRGALGFCPSLSDCLGNTVEQLLAEMGLLGDGQGGYGAGTAGIGGYTARRGPGYGLYGSLPGITSGSGFGGDSMTGGEGANGLGEGQANPDQPTWTDDPGQRTAGGMGEGDIPVRYRRRVNEYFQRLYEELQR